METKKRKCCDCKKQKQTHIFLGYGIYCAQCWVNKVKKSLQ